MTSGIHHITALTKDVQANVDFYTGFLGLRLVKRTAGFEDGEQLHLFYGDAKGSPGSIVSFLVWQNGGGGRVGLGQASELAFAVPPHSIGDWLSKALSAHIPVEGPKREFGETVLRLKDPDGIIIKLVGLDMPNAAPLPDANAPSRIRAVTLLTAEPQAAITMLERFGYRAGPVEGAITRMLSDSDAVDVRAVAGYTPGIPGAGTFDHLALRAPDAKAVQDLAKSLPTELGLVNMHDRKYFYSLYVRDAGEQLYEYASDLPGFTVDEPEESLGQTLFTPPGNEERALDLKIMLPQFALPGEPRYPRRELLFTHRLYEPADYTSDVIITLHGTGGSETSLMPLAHRVNPKARIIGLRGRATEENQLRWFRRFDIDHFDQADIASEAEAFAAFLPDLARLYDFDPKAALYIGHSNGANFLSALLRLCPEVIDRAVLLRAQEVLEAAPKVNRKGEVLLIEGEKDLLVGKRGAALAAKLQAAGLDVSRQSHKGSHELSPDDAAMIRDWLSAQR